MHNCTSIWFKACPRRSRATCLTLGASWTLRSGLGGPHQWLFKRCGRLCTKGRLGRFHGVGGHLGGPRGCHWHHPGVGGHHERLVRHCGRLYGLRRCLRASFLFLRASCWAFSPIWREHIDINVVVVLFGSWAWFGHIGLQMLIIIQG